LLSPAARRLAQGTKVRGGDAALRASYTPSRTPTLSTPSTPATPKTPRTPQLRTKRAGPTTPVVISGKLSDDLLRLPKRNRAESYFTS
jgi:hypothetical protein